MIYKKYTIYILCLITAFLLLMSPILAGYGLEEAAPQELKDQGGGDLGVLIGNIIRGFLMVLGAVFLILVIYGGMKYMLARGDVNETKKAKDVIFNALIGILIIMTSYAITDFVISRLTAPPDTTTPEAGTPTTP